MEQNHNMLRGISENGGIVFYGVDSTEIVREMERLHKTSAVVCRCVRASPVEIGSELTVYLISLRLKLI